MVWGKGIISFLLAISIALFLLRQERESKQDVVDYLFSSALYPTQLIVSKIHFRGDLQREKEALLQENVRLSYELDRMLQAEIENDRLREAFRLPRRADYDIVMGGVVARNPGRLKLSMVIDIGRSQGVEINMPVFTPSGVVGRISKVFPSHAHVQLLEDPSSKISVLENNTRTMGVLETTDSYHFFALLPSHAPLKIGDTLITSGFGGIYPKGMRVGYITGFAPGDLDVLQKVEVQLAQNPSYLEEVFVLLKRAEWILKEEQ